MKKKELIKRIEELEEIKYNELKKITLTFCKKLLRTKTLPLKGKNNLNMSIPEEYKILYNQLEVNGDAIFNSFYYTYGNKLSSLDILDFGFKYYMTVPGSGNIQYKKKDCVIYEDNSTFPSIFKVTLVNEQEDFVCNPQIVSNIYELEFVLNNLGVID